MAGIVNFKDGLSIESKSRFENALESAQTRLPWKLGTKATNSFMLAHAGFKNLWQGPKIISRPDYEAVCTGVQWKNVDNDEGAVAYLKSFLCNEQPLKDHFDYFSCAIVFPEEKAVILATDPSGLSPVFYIADSSLIVFSSHQTFLRDFLSYNLQIDWHAALEYLIIGYNIGDKSLLKNVQMIPCSSYIKYKNNNLIIKSYDDNVNLKINRKISVEEAADNVLYFLNKKFENYDNLNSKDYCSLLSGGWDSRLITSILSANNKLKICYSTQQQMNRFEGILISEKKIANEVARFLNIKNEYVDYGLPEPNILVEWLWYMDFLTWFGHWAVALTERLPYDHLTVVDGWGGGLFFRASSVDQKIIKYIEGGEKEKLISWLTRYYIDGKYYPTPGIEKWEHIINKKEIRNFSETLERDIAGQINCITSEDFFTPFFLKNRLRRGSGVAQRLIFGRKACVALPFFSLDLMKLVLTIPLKIKIDHSLYIALLEKSVKGLSKIASTNTRKYDEIKDYLVLPSINKKVLDSAREFTKNYFANVYQLSKKIKQTMSNQIYTIGRKNEFKTILDRFSLFLSDDIKSAINGNDYGKISRYYDFLNKISQLNNFYEGNSD
jgi:hypothetical protein